MAKSDENQPVDFGAELDRKIWITKGCRFNAYRRLARQHEWSMRTISVLSMYLIVAAIILVLPSARLNDAERQWIAVASIGMSIFILALGLLESSRSYQLRSDRHHRCGLELSTIYSEVRWLRTACGNDPETPKAMHRIDREYNRILSQYADNHEENDYLMFTAQQAHVFELSLPRVVARRARWWIAAGGLHAALIALPVCAFVLWQAGC